MSTKRLLSLLELYHKRYQTETEVKKLITTLRNDRYCFQRTNYSGHFTASAWILNEGRDKALMTHHKKLNMWLQLGGHADGNTDLLNVARREVFEESGIEKIQLLNDGIFDVDIHLVPKFKDQPSHKHFDIRFIFEANENNEEISFNHESYNVLWIKLDEIKNYNSEISIRRMIEKTIKEYA